MKVYAKIFAKTSEKVDNKLIDDNSLIFKNKKYLFEKTFISSNKTNNDDLIKEIVPNLLQSKLFILNQILQTNLMF
jgi:hypothetical protein